MINPKTTTTATTSIKTTITTTTAITTTATSSKQAFIEVKWQSGDGLISFEPISNCNWIEKDNDLVLSKYSFVSFTNSDQTLILYDPIKKSFVIINNEGYLFGRNYDSMILLDNGGWINPKELKSFLIKSKNCPVNEEIISKYYNFIIFLSFLKHNMLFFRENY